MPRTGSNDSTKLEDYKGGNAEEALLGGGGNGSIPDAGLTK